MSIKTDKYLNFAPEEVEWDDPQVPIEHPQEIERPPAIQNQFEGFIDRSFWAIGIGVCGMYLLGILTFISSAQLQDSQPQQAQEEVHQPPAQEPARANRPVIVKTIEVDGVTIQLDQNGDAWGTLPEHLEFSESTYPLRILDAPGGRFIRVFPTGTPFITTAHTYQTYWKWITNFDRVSGYTDFQPPGSPENKPPPGPATPSGPVFVKTLTINGLTAVVTQDGSMYGPIPIEYRFGYNMQPLQIFDEPGGRVKTVYPPKTPFIITREPIQTHWRWIADFDGAHGYTTFIPSVLSD